MSPLAAARPGQAGPRTLFDSGARQQLQFTTDGHPAAQLRIQVFNAAHSPIVGLSTGYSATHQTLTVNPVGTRITQIKN
ncbi:MAG TPA: hypothetical protein VFD36_21395 [Kofleriaceae bacterium]|nr:hypothetical protein [Kofleriaceae bacterium]